MSLITGALPAQYGFRTAGIVDIQTKTGTHRPRRPMSLYGGSRDWLQPSFDYGGRVGEIDYFVTGDFLHNGIGIENPTVELQRRSMTQTDQWHAAWPRSPASSIRQTRVTLHRRRRAGSYQIPNNPRPGARASPSTARPTSTAPLLDQSQWESTHFGIVSLQKHYGTARLPALGLHPLLQRCIYTPDPFGDLMFNGIAQTRVPQQLRHRRSQGDGSWKAHRRAHAARRLPGAARARAPATNSQVLPVDDTGAPTSDQPLDISRQRRQRPAGCTASTCRTSGRSCPTLTVNFGARFDRSTPSRTRTSSARASTSSGSPTTGRPLHAGYARYFTPPPLEQVAPPTVARFAGTTAAPAELR